MKIVLCKLAYSVMKICNVVHDHTSHSASNGRIIMKREIGIHYDTKYGMRCCFKPSQGIVDMFKDIPFQIEDGMVSFTIGGYVFTVTADGKYMSLSVINNGCTLSSVAYLDSVYFTIADKYVSVSVNKSVSFTSVFRWE